jgi:hypothetical protein
MKSLLASPAFVSELQGQDTSVLYRKFIITARAPVFVIPAEAGIQKTAFVFGFGFSRASVYSAGMASKSCKESYETAY